MKRTHFVGASLSLLSVWGMLATAAASPFKEDYLRASSKRIDEVVTKDHKTLTAEEHAAIEDHWRSAMRALRVREIAETEHDAAAVARVDTFLQKLDAAFFARLTDLNAKAKVHSVLAPPKILSPAGGQVVTVGAGLGLQIEPYKEASRYFCAASQGSSGGGHASALSEGPACGLPGSGPMPFKAGRAELVARAFVKGVWSEPAKVEIELRGAEPPPGGVASLSQPHPGVRAATLDAHGVAGSARDGGSGGAPRVERCARQRSGMICGANGDCCSGSCSKDPKGRVFKVCD